jgi:hypothetical protein
MRIGAPRPLDSARSIVCVSLSALLFCGAACDSFKSDQQRANDRIAKAAKDAAAKKNPTTQGLDAAIGVLRQAASENNASESAKINARSLLAQTEFEAAQNWLKDVHRLEPQVLRAMWDISQLSGQVAALNVSQQAMLANDPKAAVAALTTRQQEVQQSAATAGEQVKSLQEKINQVEGQIKSLTDQRNQLQQQADADFAKARNMSESEARPVLLQAIENKRKSDNVSHEIVKRSEALVPLQRDLALQQMTQKNHQDAAAALEQRKQMVEGNWTAAQDQVGKQKQLAATLGQQLTQRAGELDGLAKQGADARNKAIDLLTKSADHYADAVRIATQLNQTLQTNMGKYAGAPEQKAWRELKALDDLNNFKLLEGQVRNTLGNVHAAHAKLAGARKVLAGEAGKVLQEAGVTTPPTLAGTADQDLAAATKGADDAYKAAAALMENVANVGQPTAKPAGQMGQLFAAYGQYLSTGKPEALNLAKDQYAKLKDDPSINNLPEGMRQTLSSK